jgi:hypothetical protein
MTKLSYESCIIQSWVIKVYNKKSIFQDHDFYSNAHLQKKNWNNANATTDKRNVC